jgi:hypothetical protein
MIYYYKHTHQNTFMKQILPKFKISNDRMFIFIFSRKWYIVTKCYLNKEISTSNNTFTSMAEWITLRTRSLMIASRNWFKPRQRQVVVFLSKKLYTYCSILVGSRNGFESVFKSMASYTIELQYILYKSRNGTNWTPYCWLFVSFFKVILVSFSQHLHIYLWHNSLRNRGFLSENRHHICIATWRLMVKLHLHIINGERFFNIWDRLHLI